MKKKLRDLPKTGGAAKQYEKTILLAIGVLACIAYSNSFRVPFQFDDLRLIRFNFSLRDLGNWHAILSSEPFRPLLVAIFAFNYKISGTQTFAYHFVNLLLHLTATFLFYRLVLRSSIDARVALIATAWMAVHPLNTEAVTYISSRSILLCAAFYFAALLCFDSYLITQKRFRCLLFCAFFLLAILTKEEGALIPFAALLWNWITRGRESLTTHKTLHLVTCAFVILLGVFRVILFFKYAPEGFSPYSVWLPTQVIAGLHYLWLACVPLNLNVDPDIASFTFASPLFWIAFFILSGLIALCVKWRSRLPFVSFWGLWFFLNLSASSAVPLSDFAADHRAYISLFGFCAAASYGLFALTKKLDARAVVNFLLIAFLFLLAYGTFQRNEVWRTEISLWQDAVQKSPNKIRPHLNLAGSYFNAGKYDLAIAEYELVKSVDPENSQMHSGLGISYLRKGDAGSAESEFEQALHRDPSLIDPKTGLGVIHYRRREYQRALEYFEQSYPFRRDSIQLADMMSDAYLRLGKYDQAIQILEHALTLSNAPPKFMSRLEAAKRERWPAGRH